MTQNSVICYDRNKAQPAYIDIPQENSLQEEEIHHINPCESQIVHRQVILLIITFDIYSGTF